MDMNEYLVADAVGLAALVRAGDVAVAELRELAHRRHEATHDTINAVVEWYEQPAGPLAGEATSAGTFAGVPFLRKDFGATEAGRLVEMGSHLGAGLVATKTSRYFDLLTAAGAQVLGRTAVPEFALHATTESNLNGLTRNPIDPSVSAGGSSGGAAAAVRAGVVPFAHASDAAGSIRIPAAVTGLIGLKPTRDLVPAPTDDWRGLVTEFVLARSIADVVASLQVLVSPSVTTAPLGRTRSLRTGLSLEHWAGLPVDAEVVAAIEATARRLEAIGHRVEPVPRPFDYEQLMSTWFPLFGAGALDGIERVAAEVGRPLDENHLEPNTRELVAEVTRLTAEDHATAQVNRAAVTADVAAAFEDYDLLLTPTVDRAVIPLGRMAGDAPMGAYMADGDEWFDRLYLANVIGWPAISVPADAEPTAPPIGAQFLAPPFREDLLVGIAADLLGDSIIPPVDPPPLGS
jgi:amidase